MTEQDRADYLAFLQQRRACILERLGAALKRAGRQAGEVTLLAVSKTVDTKKVLLAHEAGYTAFAENRPQELRRKLADIAGLPQMAGVRFDMIGNLQTNKINMVLGGVELLHSVSSAHLAEAVSKRSEGRGLVTKVLLEVNVSGEKSKAGWEPDVLRREFERLLELSGVKVLGLMTMAPKGDPGRARRAFCDLRELRGVLERDAGYALPELSCGMSDDFQIAVEEGSTIIRLGRTVFDPHYVLK